MDAPAHKWSALPIICGRSTSLMPMGRNSIATLSQIPRLYKRLKLMRPPLLIIIFFFQTIDLWAQPSMPVRQIDSLFKSLHRSDTDWVICLSIDQAGTIPIYDSLGKRIYESPQGTFVLFKIGQSYFLQKLWNEYLDKPFRSKLVFGKPIKVDNDLHFNYTVDSVSLPCEEWIYPYVYKENKPAVYNIQAPADHEPYYEMYFKAMQHNGIRKFFTETSLDESKNFMPYKNLNYLYNTQTFIYRSFCNLLSLVKQKSQVWVE